MIVTGPGSAVGEKAKKLDRIGKISEKKRAERWPGEGKGRRYLSLPQTSSRLASFADMFLLFPHSRARSHANR